MKTKSYLLLTALLLSLVQSARTEPMIVQQPRNQTTVMGSNATFSVAITADQAYSLQWRSYAADATTFTNIPFANNTALLLVNVQPTTRLFGIVLTYSGGAVTSTLASLTVLVPPTGHRIEGITANPDYTISLDLAGLVPTPFTPYYDIYPLEASTNLTDWAPLITLLRTNASSAALIYRDPDASGLPNRFYRTPTNFLITPCSKPSGPYPVGTVSRLMTDPSRTNRSNIPTNSSFMVTLWYPAEARVGVLPEAYVESNATLYAYLNERNPSIVGRFVSHALPGLPVATNENSYPVVIYSHGGGFRRQNTDKAVDLASHGYVVVAMDHPWATASVFPSGQVVSGSGTCSNPKACFQPTIDDGINDYRFVLDEMARLNTNDALFTGRVDLDRLGALGFSLGCVPVAEFCRIDARCKAVVLLDVGWILEAPTDLNQFGLQKPFLSMNSFSGPRPPAPPSPPYTTEWLYGSLLLFTNAIDNAFWLQIQDSSHQSFQDRGSLISNHTRTSDPTPASRAQSQTIRACTLSFFDKYLKDRDDHLLDNPVAIYPNIINFRSK